MLVILLALVTSGHVVGQDTPPEPSPPEGALFLLLPVGAEGVSLGRAMTAVTSPEAAFWNPAGLASLSQSEFLVMRGDPLAGVSTAISWLMVRQPLGILGLSYHLLDGGQQNLVDDLQNVRGTISIRSQVGIVSVATPLARWLAYLAVEGVAWIAFGRAQRSATDERGQYQDLAWDVARSFNGPRVDGDFRYYETMEKFLASGAFDTDSAAPGIQPEMDPSTFNGRVWSLSTEIYFPAGANPGPGDPEYEAALVDYQTRAYAERFEWSWAGQSASWTDYMDLIDSSDGSFRRASQFLGVVVANHLLSGVDAFVTARIQGSGRNQAEAQIRLVPRDDRKGLGLVLQVRH